MIARSVKGPARLRLLRAHRLAEFDRVFSAFIEGKVDASLVAVRAQKMLAVGLRGVT